ncbi:acyl-CoA dehydratase activase [Geoglobus acetivorans]|uniref:2-hydroxyglutaryl-CoA dehydratase subunit HgdC n=1 Tax=Geoglobus acetivorans TaxID=565033 RepID=A0A0A7GDF7_GEOAI|nr:2-hydroxyglutaryl-CoA dehydratase subunit HgdC [Geoglobus acetivorans]
MALYFAGIDIGSLAIKVCVVDGDGNIAAYHIAKTEAKLSESGKRAYLDCLRKAGLDEGDVLFRVATGYGRNLASQHFADEKVTEITCHATGAKKIFDSVRTVIDIGGQDSKVIGLSGEGKVVRFTMNDKCAAGTGKFLEVMAERLGVSLNEMSEMHFRSRKKITITSVCTVFAESEVISLLAQGEEAEDIVAGLHESIAKRIYGLVKQVGIVEDVVMTGGVAKNRGVVSAIEQELGVRVLVPEEPQVVGAYGAALIARDKFKKFKK